MPKKQHSYANVCSKGVQKGYPLKDPRSFKDITDPSQKSEVIEQIVMCSC